VGRTQIKISVIKTITLNQQANNTPIALLPKKTKTMQWFGGRESDNVEQGSSSGGGRGLAFGGGIIGLIGFVIYLFTGINPGQLFNSGQPDQSQQQQQTEKLGSSKTREERFASVVLAGTEDVWDSVFTSMGRTYTKSTLHLIRGRCGSRGLRLCQFGYRAVLLPGRPKGIPRPIVFHRPERPL
jgi:hypothetical protein